MKKETEDLLRNYWYEGYKFVFITFDNAVFISKRLYGVDTKKELLLNLSNYEVIYLPIDELKDLFSTNTRSVTIKKLVKVVDWNVVKVDTPVIVKRKGTGITLKRHFKEFIPESKKVVVFKSGYTSWSNQEQFNDYFDISEVTLP